STGVRCSTCLANARESGSFSSFRMLLFSGSRANRFLLRLNRLMCIWRLNIRDYLGAYGSSTFRKRVSFYGAMPPAFVFGKDRFAGAAIAGLFRSGPAQNVGA